MDLFFLRKTIFKPPHKIVLRPLFKNLLQNYREEWFEFSFQEPSSRQSYEYVLRTFFKDRLQTILTKMT